jgi:hypothetical protein
MKPRMFLILATLASSACKERPPPPPNEPPAAATPDPDEIVLLQQQRARAASSIATRAAPSASSANGDSGVPGRPSATADVLALLGDLTFGDLLGPAGVTYINPVVRGSVVIDLGYRAERGAIFFVKLSDGPPPPAASEKYAVYYRSEKAQGAMSNSDLEAACVALAARLRTTENQVPEPRGLTGFSAEAPAPTPSTHPR